MNIRILIKFLHVICFGYDRRLKRRLTEFYHLKLRNKQFKYFSEHHLRADVQCPICDSLITREITYYFEGNKIIKYYCASCNHLWSLPIKLPNNVERAHAMFNYTTPSIKFPEQVYVLNKLLDISAKKNGNYLDFGIGGNAQARDLVQENNGNCELWACDIVEFSIPVQRYFVSYNDETKIGFFDGIASSHVCEHLDETLEAWRYMNRLLRPMNKGGGQMVHVFPSLIDAHADDTMIVIGSHVCLFSKESLLLCCKKTGFKWTATDTRSHYPVYLFKKIMDV